jgi:hypothetical protein
VAIATWEEKVADTFVEARKSRQPDYPSRLEPTAEDYPRPVKAPIAEDYPRPVEAPIALPSPRPVEAYRRPEVDLPQWDVPQPPTPSPPRAPVAQQPRDGAKSIFDRIMDAIIDVPEGLGIRDIASRAIKPLRPIIREDAPERIKEAIKAIDAATETAMVVVPPEVQTVVGQTARQFWRGATAPWQDDVTPFSGFGKDLEKNRVATKRSKKILQELFSTKPSLGSLRKAELGLAESFETRPMSTQVASALIDPWLAASAVRMGMRGGRTAIQGARGIAHPRVAHAFYEGGQPISASEEGAQAALEFIAAKERKIAAMEKRLAKPGSLAKSFGTKDEHRALLGQEKADLYVAKANEIDYFMPGDSPLERIKREALEAGEEQGLRAMPYHGRAKAYHLDMAKPELDAYWERLDQTVADIEFGMAEEAAEASRKSQEAAAIPPRRPLPVPQATRRPGEIPAEMDVGQVQPGMGIGERPRQGELLGEVLDEGQVAPLMDAEVLAARMTREAQIAAGQRQLPEIPAEVAAATARAGALPEGAVEIPVTPTVTETRLEQIRRLDPERAGQVGRSFSSDLNQAAEYVWTPPGVEEWTGGMSYVDVPQDVAAASRMVPGAPIPRELPRGELFIPREYADEARVFWRQAEDATIAARNAAASSLPPVKSGEVRLFRGMAEAEVASVTAREAPTAARAAEALPAATARAEVLRSGTDEVFSPEVQAGVLRVKARPSYFEGTSSADERFELIITRPDGKAWNVLADFEGASGVVALDIAAPRGVVAPGGLSTTEVRTIHRIISDLFPKAEEIEGLRVTIGHHGGGRTLQRVPTTARPVEVPTTPTTARAGVTPAVREVSEAALLPRELAGAKPNYNMGRTQYTPQFESDVDKALFIVSQAKKSARDESYMGWLRGELPDLSNAQLRAAGRDVRTHIKATVSGMPEGDVVIPLSRTVRELVGGPTIAPTDVIPDVIPPPTRPITPTGEVPLTPGAAPPAPPPPPPPVGVPPVRPGAPTPPPPDDTGAVIMADFSGTPEEILATATRPEVWRNLGQKYPKLKRVIGWYNPSAVATKPYELWKLGVAISSFQGKNLSQAAMARVDELGPQADIFGKVGDDGRLSEGPLKGLTVNTVRTYPGRYTKETTDLMKEWIARMDDVERAKLQYGKDHGVKINKIVFEEGGHYAGRRVYGKFSKDGEIIQVGSVSAGSRRPGYKLPIQKHRVFKDDNEALDLGFRYLPDDEALRLNVEGMYNKVSEQKWTDWLMERVDHRLKEAPRALVLARNSAKQRLGRARQLKAAINRAVRKRPVSPSTFSSIARAFPEESATLRELIPVLQTRSPNTASEIQRLTAQADDLITDSKLRWLEAKSDTAEAAEKAAQPAAMEASLDAPAFNKFMLTGDDAQEIAAAINAEMSAKVPDWLNTINQYQGVSRFFMLAGDVSPATIQLLWMAGYKPRIYGKAVAGIVHSMFDPAFHRRYMAQPENIAALQKYPMLVSTRGGGTELTEMMGRGGLLESGPLKILGMPLKPFQRGFEGGLEIAGIELVKSLDNMAKSAGDVSDITAFINEFRGLAASQLLGVSATQRQLEALVLLAPRYFRAIASLMFNVTRGGIRGRLARQAMARGVAALTFTGIVFSYARGESTKEVIEHLTPGHPKFFTWEIGGQNIGPGSRVRSVMMLFGRSARDPESLAQIDGSNPLVKFARGLPSPGLGFALDFITGSNAVGDRTRDTYLDAAQTITEKFIPISAGTLFFEGGSPQERVTRFAGEFAGLRTYPVNIKWKLAGQWRGDFDDYYDISTDPEERAKKRQFYSRTEYRRSHPLVDAKLFIIGRVKTLRTGSAQSYAAQLMREENVMSYHVPEKLEKAYENVFGKKVMDLFRSELAPEPWPTPPPREPGPITTERYYPSEPRSYEPITTERYYPTGKVAPEPSGWPLVRAELDSGLLKSLARLWYGNEVLGPLEESKLRAIHQRHQLGQPDFRAWVKQTLRQLQEKDAVAVAR